MVIRPKLPKRYDPPNPRPINGFPELLILLISELGRAEFKPLPGRSLPRIIRSYFEKSVVAMLPLNIKSVVNPAGSSNDLNAFALEESVEYMNATVLALTVPIVNIKLIKIKKYKKIFFMFSPQ
ncbi:MAG: hypothetical protein OIN88_07100 [Candidatus Methanoperedens sp.]|nr:hypothetical protein [Candidatus Methanoperedens sp.]MCZ7360949.1 hypothetical protein [Candidatus Methanoperedens sp.]